MQRQIKQLRAIFRKYGESNLARGLRKMRAEDKVPGISAARAQKSKRAQRIFDDNQYINRYASGLREGKVKLQISKFDAGEIENIDKVRKEHATYLKTMRAELGSKGARKAVKKIGRPAIFKSKPVITYSATAALASLLGSTLHPKKSARKKHRKNLKKAFKSTEITLGTE